MTPKNLREEVDLDISLLHVYVYRVLTRLNHIRCVPTEPGVRFSMSGFGPGLHIIHCESARATQRKKTLSRHSKNEPH